MRFALMAMILVSGSWLQSPVQPDFSGKWTLDSQRSTMTPSGPAAMFGSSFVAKQDAKALSLDILYPGGTIQAVYKLDGSESRNQIPGPNGPETIVSRATWDGTRLVIVTRSTEELNGKPVQMETKRVMSLGSDGALNLQRTGTPVELVPPTTSVYKRTK
jgi:hypothetical protein